MNETAAVSAGQNRDCPIHLKKRIGWSLFLIFLVWLKTISFHIFIEMLLLQVPPLGKNRYAFTFFKKLKGFPIIYMNFCIKEKKITKYTENNYEIDLPRY